MNPIQIIAVLCRIGIARRVDLTEHFVFPRPLLTRALPGCRWSFSCSHDSLESFLLRAESERSRYAGSSKSAEIRTLQLPQQRCELHPARPSRESRLERPAASLVSVSSHPQGKAKPLPAVPADARPLRIA